MIDNDDTWTKHCLPDGLYAFSVSPFDPCSFSCIPLEILVPFVRQEKRKILRKRKGNTTASERRSRRFRVIEDPRGILTMLTKDGRKALTKELTRLLKTATSL